MTVSLRIVLLVICLITFWYVVRKIRKSQIQIEDAVFWIILSFVLLILAVFPSIARLGARILGVLTVTNFVFLAIIFVLLIKLFSLSIHLSQMDNRIKQLAQQIALLHQKDQLPHSSAGMRDEPKEHQDIYF